MSSLEIHRPHGNMINCAIWPVGLHLPNSKAVISADIALLTVMAFRNLWQNVQKSHFKLIFRQPWPKETQIRRFVRVYIFLQFFCVCLLRKWMFCLSFYLGLAHISALSALPPQPHSHGGGVGDFTENSDACPLVPPMACMNKLRKNACGLD